MKNLLGMIPGMAAHRKELEQFDEKEVDRTEAIIRSMTPAERRDPSIIDGSRRRRIAFGSGVTVSQVNALLQRFEQAAKMMKRVSNNNGGGLPGFGGPAMGKKAKKGKKKKGSKSGNPMPQNPALPAGLQDLMNEAGDNGTPDLPPNLGGGVAGLFGR